MKYMSYLQDRGLSSSAIGLRKSAVSSFCNYIENDDNYEEYVNYMKCIEYLSKKEEERLFQEILQERRRLYALGLYELEEGEILE
jgi:hypothetical protein